MATLERPIRSPAGAPPQTSNPRSTVWTLGMWLVAAVAVVAALLTALDLDGRAVLWENVHWTLFAGIALVLAIHGARSASGPERGVRIAICIATTMWFSGQMVWDVQGMLGLVVVPAPSDFLFLATIVPAFSALDLAVRQGVDRRERLGLYLDSLITFLAIATVMTLLFGNLVTEHDAISGAMLLSLPISFLSLGGAGLIAALATHARPTQGGLFLLLIGTLLLGAGYVPWVAQAPAVPAPGTWSNYLFSVGILTLGFAGVTFRHGSAAPAYTVRLGGFIRDAVPVIAVAVAVGCLVSVTVTNDDGTLVRPLGWGVIVSAVLRQVLLVRERSAAIHEAGEAASHLAAAEARHRRLIERIPAVLYVDERASADDPRSRLTYVSPQAATLLSHSIDELMGDPELWYRLIHPDDAANVAAAENEHFGAGTPLQHSFRLRDRDGRQIWVRDEATLHRLPDGRLQSHGVLMDITAQVNAEEAVRASEEQQRQIVETASSAYVAIDGEGFVTDWNERAIETFGWSRSEAIGRRLSELIIPEEQRAAHEAGLRRFAVVGSGPLVGRRIEVTALDRSGRRFPVELSIWPVRTGDTIHYSALIHDITERRRLEDELRHQAFHDSLTGLANRALFADRLDHALLRRGTDDVGVLFFDVDDFKLINDGLGHSAGDGLLIEVARRLGEVIRAEDTAARLGGDEFGILLEHTTELEAAKVADRVIRSFQAPFDIAGHHVNARASIGVALGRAGSDAATVLREADSAMYAAKRNGKGVWQMFDASMAGDGLLEIELRADLKQAIDTGGLKVVFQPIVDLVTRRTVGVEALARWTHATRGVIEPSQFIPLAETANLIVPLGRWVLQQACRAIQAQRLSMDGPADLHLSVNISPRQLLHGTIVDDVRAALADSGLAPASLTLEITEGVLVEEAGASLAALEGLKSLGVRIAIDDFGTGYSSLSYLSRLPIDVLKIDRSFIADIGTSLEAAALVRSIVSIGRALHLETVAEGVETEEQLDRLARLGAKLGQGYLFSRPLEASALADLLARGRSDAA